jgi:hypothetical protein
LVGILAATFGLFGIVLFLPPIDYFSVLFGLIVGLPLSEVASFVQVSLIENRAKSTAYAVVQESRGSEGPVLMKSAELVPRAPD